MNLTELKKKSPADLMTMAADMGIENIARARKQEVIFSILKSHAKNGEDIFGDGVEKAETVYLKMDREDKIAYRKLSDDQFKADTLNEVSGMRSLQKGYKEDYNDLSDDIKNQFWY